MHGEAPHFGLGHADAELERLRLQSAIYAGVTPPPDPRMRNRAGSAAARKLTIQRAVAERSGSLRRARRPRLHSTDRRRSLPALNRGPVRMKRAACHFYLLLSARRAARS